MQRCSFRIFSMFGNNLFLLTFIQILFSVPIYKCLHGSSYLLFFSLVKLIYCLSVLKEKAPPNSKLLLIIYKLFVMFSSEWTVSLVAIITCVKFCHYTDIWSKLYSDLFSLTLSMVMFWHYRCIIRTRCDKNAIFNIACLDSKSIAKTI